MICSPSAKPSNLSRPLIQSWRHCFIYGGLRTGPLSEELCRSSNGIAGLGIEATGAADCSGVRGRRSQPDRRPPTASLGQSSRRVKDRAMRHRGASLPWRCGRPVGVGFSNAFFSFYLLIPTRHSLDRSPTHKTAAAVQLQILVCAYHDPLQRSLT